MKRILTALVLTSFSACLMVGCSEESKMTDEKTVKTPDGTAKVTTDTTVEKSGDMKDSATPEAAKPAEAPHE